MPTQLKLGEQIFTVCLNMLGHTYFRFKFIHKVKLKGLCFRNQYKVTLLIHSAIFYKYSDT